MDLEGQGGFRVENLVSIVTVNMGVLFLCLSSDLFSHTTMIVFIFQICEVDGLASILGLGQI